MRKAFAKFVAAVVFTCAPYCTAKATEDNLFPSYRIRALEEAGAKVESQGTAFHYKNVFITANHVIEGCKFYKVEIGKEWYTLELINSDYYKDTAVLRLQNTPLTKPIPFKSGKCKEDDIITGYFSCKGEPITRVDGRLVRLESDVGSYLYLARFKAASGASGGPVVNKDSKLIGMLIQQVIYDKPTTKKDTKELNDLIKVEDSSRPIGRSDLWQLVPVEYIDRVIEDGRRSDTKQTGSGRTK